MLNLANSKNKVAHFGLNMLISSPTDFRSAARRKLPRFLFDYIDGAAGMELTKARNSLDLDALQLQQRVLANVAEIDLSCTVFGERLALPLALAPVGLTGMYARRGEVQARKAAASRSVPYCLSTVSVCDLEEVSHAASQPFWFQLYVIRDRSFMRDMILLAQESGCSALVFTVDMPVPGSRYRDVHSGLSGPHAPMRRALQVVGKPAWAFDVGLLGRPHTLGNLAPTLKGKASGLEDFMGWLGRNFDPSISWRDLEWIRDLWNGPLIIKGIMAPADAKAAVDFGADAIVVSNHGGRQLDGAGSTLNALQPIRQEVGDSLTVFADSGIRNGTDIVKMIASGADAVLLGRAYIYALAASGQTGVERLIDLIEMEMRTTMALIGTTSLAQLNRSCLG